MIDLQEVEKQSASASAEICEASGIKEGQIFVVGCSSSEVLGSRIGTATNVEVPTSWAGLSSENRIPRPLS